MKLLSLLLLMPLISSCVNTSIDNMNHANAGRIHSEVDTSIAEVSRADDLLAAETNLKTAIRSGISHKTLAKTRVNENAEPSSSSDQLLYRNFNNKHCFITCPVGIASTNYVDDSSYDKTSNEKLKYKILKSNNSAKQLSKKLLNKKSDSDLKEILPNFLLGGEGRIIAKKNISINKKLLS